LHLGVFFVSLHKTIPNYYNNETTMAYINVIGSDGGAGTADYHWWNRY
jgi:hypothetical protein